MDQPRWKLIKSIVDQALTLEGLEKDTYIEEVKLKYHTISTEVIEILQSIEESEREHFLEEIWSDQKHMLLDISGKLNEGENDEPLINKEIGAYRLAKVIGRGGMGTVFKASRADGEFHKEVAIKIIKNGLGTGNTILRFKVERAILAGLHHSNIAHLLDGGVTEEGMPYLIMEYVDGIPIDEYCDDNRLTLSERLDLFKDVCAAVQHAHSNLIVHRDLKPQNIYVTQKGIVKILDFGIAKLLNPHHRQISSVETMPGQKIWTPQYAAPEQVRDESITVATDIYALGVLLHHLFTGSYPYDLEGKTLTEMEETIKTVSPLTPSRSLETLEDPKKCAAFRKNTFDALHRKLQGDLDALVSKAIRKEPGYRYQSAAQLSEDIDRYKSGLPLIAREGKWRYRTGKFIRRNKASLLAVASLLILLLLFGGFYTWRITEERDIAQVERDKLEQVVDFLTGLIEFGNPTENPVETVNTKVFLKRGVEEVQQLERQPDVQTHILNVIGDVYLALGEYKQAEKLYSNAVNIQEDVLGPDNPALAKSLNNLALVLTRQGKYQIARDTYNKSLAIQIRHFGEEHPEVAETLSLFGSWIPVTNIHEAARMRERALDINRAVFGDDHLEVATSYMGTGRIKRNLVRPVEAIHDFRKALHIRKSKLGMDHPDVAESMIFLGDMFRLYNIKSDSAEIHYRNALIILQDKYQSYHPALLHVLGSYAKLLSENGDQDYAQKLLRQSLDVRRTVFGEGHPKTTDGYLQLGNEFYRQGKYKRAVELFRSGLDRNIEILGEEHMALVGIMRDLAKSLIALKRFNEAENYLERALLIQREKFKNKSIALTFGALAELKLQKGSLGEAEEFYRQALSIYQNNDALEHYEAVKVQNKLDKLQLIMLQRQ